MKREELIKKWLDHNLNADEQKAFEHLEDYNRLMEMDSALKSFKAPIHNIETSYNTLKPKLQPASTKRNLWFKPLFKIAAALVIGLSVYYYSTALDSEIITHIVCREKIRKVIKASS